MPAVEFRRTITAPEVNGNYLNLTDDAGAYYGRRYFSHIPHLGTIVVLDGSGRITYAQKHHNNQIWGTLVNWFGDNNVQAGTQILVRFDRNETRENKPVLHLLVEGVPTLSLPKTNTEDKQAEINTEIPLSLERQLEDFLVGNLEMIEKKLVLYTDEGGNKGRQYPTDVGNIDLLCCRPDGSFLVIELKRGRVADEVVGQISRYVGWVKHEIANGKPVSGLILSHKEDKALEYAVLANPNLKLRYFRLKLELLPSKEIGE
jgi:endonuclease